MGIEVIVDGWRFVDAYMGSYSYTILVLTSQPESYKLENQYICEKKKAWNTCKTKKQPGKKKQINMQKKKHTKANKGKTLVKKK